MTQATFQTLPISIEIDGKTLFLQIEFYKDMCYISYVTGYGEDMRWPSAWDTNAELAIDRMKRMLLELGIKTEG